VASTDGDEGGDEDDDVYDGDGDLVIIIIIGEN